MAWAWNAVGAWGVSAGIFAWILAIAVYFLGPRRPQNLWLALLLVAEGGIIFWGNGVMYFARDPAAAYAAQIVGFAWGFLWLWLDLVFISTIDSPLARPLARPGARFAVALLGATALASLFLQRDAWILGVAPAAYAPYDSVEGPWLVPYFTIALVAGPLFGFAVAVDSWRRSQGALARRRARLFSAAFGLRAAGFVVLAVFDNVLGILAWMSSSGIQFIVLAFVALLAYGILTAQLFDIDLRIKWTIRRGTLVGAFALVFVLVAEIAQNWLSDAFGYLAGGLAAAVLLVALRPLDRISGRVADAAMPRVQATDEYLTFRKHEIYRNAVQDAALDGVITQRERAILDGLRRSLAIDAAVADALEREPQTG